MKYCVDIVIHQRKDFVPVLIREYYKSMEAAQERRAAIIDDLTPGQHLGWNKVFPVIECCGQEIDCYKFTNSCDICDKDYNFNGAMLLPRELWIDDR